MPSKNRKKQYSQRVYHSYFWKLVPPLPNMNDMAGLKTRINKEFTDSENQRIWAEAKKEHGLKQDQSGWLLPRDVRESLGEKMRALYVLEKWQAEGCSGNPLKFLRHYSVLERTILEVAKEYLDMEVNPDDVAEQVKVEKRSDKYDAFVDWTKDKLFEQFTTEQLVEVSGFSYQTTLKFISESPHFRKIKKGLWEIRDPKADKEAGL